MKILQFLLPFFMVSICISSCKKDDANAWKEMSLLAYEMPIEVSAPDSVDAKSEDWIVQKTVSLTNESEDYFLLVSMKTAEGVESSSIKDNLLTEIKEESAFSEVLEEDDSGFLYGMKLDSTTTQYDFRRIRLEGNNQYVFQMDILPRVYTLEQVQRMYEASDELEKE